MSLDLCLAYRGPRVPVLSAPACEGGGMAARWGHGSGVTEETPGAELKGGHQEAVPRRPEPLSEGTVGLSCHSLLALPAPAGRLCPLSVVQVNLRMGDLI